MKKIFVLAVSMACLTSFAQSKKDLIKQVAEITAQNDSLKTQVVELAKKKEVNMENTQEKFSYALGVNIGQNLQQQGLEELNAELLAAGLSDFLAGNPKMEDQEIGAILQAEMQKAQAAKQKEEQEKFAGNVEAGRTFLAENAKREGVTTLPSGLQYEVITAGKGAKPAPTDKVKVHYHGTLIDGTVFDSSVDRGQPAEFGVTQVIQGWVEGLQLMPEGSKWKLFIPYELAYGDRGAGGAIGPFSALVFEVELLEIVK